MGVWGTGLYGSDDASDIRDEYQALWQFGVVGSEARELLESHFAKDLENDSVFWLTLADLQWKSGILEDLVRKKALDAIKSGKDLETWSKTDQKARRRILSKLADNLGKTFPKSRKHPERFIEKTDFEIEDLLALYSSKNVIAILRVASIHKTLMGAHLPVIEVMDWTEARVPTALEAAQLTSRFVDEKIISIDAFTEEHFQRQKAEPAWKIPSEMALEDYILSYRSPLYPLRFKKKSDPYSKRVERLGIRLPGIRRIPCFHEVLVGPETAWFWSDFEEKLEKVFGIK